VSLISGCALHINDSDVFKGRLIGKALGEKGSLLNDRRGPAEPRAEHSKVVDEGVSGGMITPGRGVRAKIGHAFGKVMIYWLAEEP
jgi:hypothetical protein